MYIYTQEEFPHRRFLLRTMTSCVLYIYRELRMQRSLRCFAYFVCGTNSFLFLERERRLRGDKLFYSVLCVFRFVLQIFERSFILKIQTHCFFFRRTIKSYDITQEQEKQ